MVLDTRARPALAAEYPPVAVWTAALTAQFLNAIAGHRLYAAAGHRRSDVDLDEWTAVISQQLQQHDGYLAVCPPKTLGAGAIAEPEP